MSKTPILYNIKKLKDSFIKTKTLQRIIEYKKVFELFYED